MRLSELIKLAVEVTGEDDPNVKIPGEGGFLEISEVLPRSAYRDEHPAFGNKFESGNFACLVAE